MRLRKVMAGLQQAAHDRKDVHSGPPIRYTPEAGGGQW
jgi:hypothetical protein